MGKDKREPTPREWLIGRELVKQLQALHLGLSEEQLHIIRSTAICVLMESSTWDITAIRKGGTKEPA